jgi:DNA polymerase II large subunit
LYNASTSIDLVGQLAIVLAPHTSAGMVGRIIGFSKTQGLFAHPLLHAATRRDCDGDEACIILLMDAFLNFSKKFLPGSRGSTMDTPLVLTSVLTPGEVDDMAFDVDIAWQYPLELYEAALQYKSPREIKIPQIKACLGKPGQYENMGFTHDITNLNKGVLCSAYKILPSMEDKLKGQMDLAEKLRSVDASDVARLVIEKHFLKDTKGNLRKFSMQEFRCVNCNEKFRRPPLVGKCTKCNGKIVFTISEGSVSKYLEPTISLAKKYNVSPYLQQVIELLRVRLESVFGKEPDKQVGLGAWFG